MHIKNFILQNLCPALFAVLSNAQAFDKISLVESNALFAIEEKTVPLVGVNYIGWEKDWKWAGTDITPKISTSLNIASGNFSGSVKDLGIDFTGSVTQNTALLPRTHESNWKYQWTFSEFHPFAVGYGLEFNLNLNSSTFDRVAQDPILLPNKEGWRWTTPDNQTIEVKFSPALAEIYFERNQKSKIRVLFFGPVNTGFKQTAMKVTINRNIALSAPASFNYDRVDARAWHKNILSDLASPYDLSFLNTSNIKDGELRSIKASGDKLVYADDNAPVKFWGANLMAYALFNTDDVNIPLHAKRLSKLGFNLVRIHHHDSDWVNPNIFNSSANTLDLSPTSLRKLDLWIKSLKDQGIYVWLDLHVGRKFTTNDNIINFYDFAKGNFKSEAKGFTYYNNSIQDRMQEFNNLYLNHVNRYTGIAYKDDPVLAGMLITNENDLSFHFGNALLADKGVPLHHALFTEDAKQFAGLNPNLTLSKVMSTWLMGESKIYLNDAEHRFNIKMLDHLNELGINSLVATTSSWGTMGIYGLPALTDGSIIDVHAYGKGEEFNYNPRYSPGFLSWVAGAQVTGKPLSVSEWNIESFPAADRFTAPLFTASLANLQGWDAMMLYGYSQTELNGTTTFGSNYSSFNDPAMIGLMPTAALLYRQNHVSPARLTYELKMGRNNFFFAKIDPTTSQTIRTLLETSRLTIGMPYSDTPELPWLKLNSATAQNATAVSSINKDFIPAGQNFVQSDTAELKRDWQTGIHTVNTAKSQAASGWIGRRQINLSNISLNVFTKKAVVAVQSLENKPISSSAKIFITAMARSQPVSGSNLPFISEPVTGTMTVKAPSGLKLYAIGSNGVPALSTAATFKVSTGRYVIDLTKANGHWFVLQ
jgi:hypothetical protein